MHLKKLLRTRIWKSLLTPPTNGSPSEQALKSAGSQEKGQTTSDLAYEASKKALKAAGLAAEEIDLIIVATMTPDMILPSLGCVLQERLGARKAAAFDIYAACSGFIYGMSVASAYIKSEMYKNILLVGAEVLSRYTDWEDRSTCILFGDGAGAAVIQRHTGKRGILSTHIHSDGSQGNLDPCSRRRSTEPRPLTKQSINACIL